MANRPATRSLAFLVALGPTLAIPAQEQAPPSAVRKEAARAGQRAVWIGLRKYDARSSRRAFAACDTDGDDRLDVREARRALPNMGPATDPAGFRALDADRNGFVQWTEFDGRYRRTSKAGDKFLFRPSLPFRQRRTNQTATGADRTRGPVDRIMTLVDDDGDSHLDKGEFVKLLATLQQPASLAGAFVALDQDRSGNLSADELAPIVAKIPNLLELAKPDPATAATAVSETALRQRLSRIHPTLARWSSRIFRTADRDGDGSLSSEEIDPTAK